MQRLRSLVLLATPVALAALVALVAATSPPGGATSPRVAAAAVEVCPTTWHGAERLVGANRPLEPPNTDASGAGHGTPRSTPAPDGPTPARHTLLGDRFRTFRPGAFHLRDRPAHPANAPPSRA
jgi:hypothetical protein